VHERSGTDGWKAAQVRKESEEMISYAPDCISKKENQNQTFEINKSEK